MGPFVSQTRSIVFPTHARTCRFTGDERPGSAKPARQAPSGTSFMHPDTSLDANLAASLPEQQPGIATLPFEPDLVLVVCAAAPLVLDRGAHSQRIRANTPRTQLPQSRAARSVRASRVHLAQSSRVLDWIESGATLRALFEFHPISRSTAGDASGATVTNNFLFQLTQVLFRSRVTSPPNGSGTRALADARSRAGVTSCAGLNRLLISSTDHLKLGTRHVESRVDRSSTERQLQRGRHCHPAAEPHIVRLG